MENKENRGVHCQEKRVYSPPSVEELALQGLALLETVSIEGDFGDIEEQGEWL